MPEAAVVDVPLRWSDLDPQGHVNNATVLDLLQEARVRLMLDGPAGEMTRHGVVVTAHQVEYVAPILLTDAPLQVRIGVGELGAARFRFDHELWHEGALCVRARTTCCPFDVATQRPRRLTEAERAQLAAHAVAPTELRELPHVAMGGQGYAYPLAVRWSDQDRFGHVNNVRYYDFVQESRIRLMMTADPAMARVGTPGASYVWFIARQDIDYLAQVDYRREPWVVRTGVVRFGNTSMTLTAELRESDAADAAVAARLSTVLVCADAGGVPTPVPQRFRDVLAPYVVS